MNKIQKEPIRKKAFLICLAGMDSIVNSNTGQVLVQAQQCLQQLERVSNLMVVTDENVRIAYAQWNSYHLPHCTMISTRNKTLTQVIAELLNLEYERKKVLVVGFGTDIVQQAQQSGVLFYPILPNEAPACWSMLLQESALKLLHGTYQGEYQRQLLARHHTALPK